MNLAEQIARFLDSRGVGTWGGDSAGGTLFIETMPPSPDTCIAIQHIGGAAGQGIPIIQPLFQLFVRGDTDARTALDLACTALRELRYHTGRLVPAGDDVSIVWPEQDYPNYTGIDQNGRHVYSFDVRLRVNEQLR